MSHHFDTPTGREDPRLNLCDVYLFAGNADTMMPAVQTPVTAKDSGSVDPWVPTAAPPGYLRLALGGD